MVQGRCMRCKKQVDIKLPNVVIMKNGRKAITGTCPVCGTKIYKILGKQKSQEESLK